MGIKPPRTEIGIGFEATINLSEYFDENTYKPEGMPEGTTIIDYTLVIDGKDNHLNSIAFANDKVFLHLVVSSQGDYEETIQKHSILLGEYKRKDLKWVLQKLIGIL